MNKINEATCFFLLKSEKKTDEGGPEKQFIFFLFVQNLAFSIRKLVMKYKLLQRKVGLLL